MIKILFICHGNICRSPMAEFVLKDMVRKAGVADRFLIESAATSSEEIWNGRGNPVYPPAKAELARHGIGVAGNELGVNEKRARQIVKADYTNYDYLIGMDQNNLRAMKRTFGTDPEEKLHLLMDFTDDPRSVADPWYTRDFQQTWKDVEEGCEAFLRRLHLEAGSL